MKKRLSIIVSLFLLVAFSMQVLAFSSIPVKSIKLNSSAISIKVGQTYTLKATLNPSDTTQKTLAFSTANSKVATVDKTGRIKGIKAGKTVVTVTSTANKKVMAKCNVTVIGTEKKKQVTLSILLQVANSLLINNQSDVMKELKKRTGITLDWTITQRNADVNQAIPILTAGGDLPDIVCTGVKYNDLIKGNAIIPLDELITTNGANIIKNASEGLALNRATRSNGTNKLYYIPGSFGSMPFNPLYAAKGWSVRWDLYKKLGYPKMETMDQFLDVLKQMMALEPKTKDGKKTYGFGGFFGESWGYVIPGQSETNVWGDLLSGIMFQNLKTNEIKPQFATLDDPMFKSFEFWNKAFRMGILDPESLAMKFQEYQDIAVTGRYFATSLTWMGASQMNGKYVSEGEPEKGFVQFIIGNTSGAADIFEGMPLGSGYQFAISKNCKTPDRAMDLFNYLCTEEGSMLLKHGVEGVHYKKNPDGSVNRIGEASDENILKQEIQAKTGIGVFGNLVLLDTPAVNVLNIEKVKKDLLPVQKDYCKYYGVEYPMQQILKGITHPNYDGSIISAISPQSGTDLEEIQAAINAYLPTGITKLVFQNSAEDFAKEKVIFFDKLKKMGIEKLQNYLAAEYNKLYKQVKKK